MNAVDPVFNMPIFDGAFAAGADYLDMAMSLSKPHPDGAVREDRREARRRAVRGRRASGRRPAGWRWSGSASSRGSPTCSRGTPPTTCSREIDELGTRDGANLVVTDDDGNEIFAPSFSMWTTIEECLNPPVIWAGRRSGTPRAPFSEPEVFDFPEGIGPVECVNVEHEEVLLMPRWVDCKRATFKYGLGDEFINILKVLHTLGLDSTEKVRVKGVEVSPRDVVAAVLPDPATVGPRMKGKTCAGLWVTGKGKDGEPSARRTSTTWSTTSGRCAEYGHQCVVWQTAINPVVALELLAARHLDGRRRARPGGLRRRARSSTC